MRIRFIGTESAPQIQGTKYADGPVQIYMHWPPDDLKEQIGNQPVPCINARAGCIFHQEPLKWSCNKNNYVNVVVYDDFDAKKKTFSRKRIVMFDCKSTLSDQILEQCNSMNIRPDQCDWLISKAGEGKSNTTYSAVLCEVPLEETIDLNEFEEQADYSDNEIPVLIDPFKFNAGGARTPDQQREWYDRVCQDAEQLNQWGDQPAEGEAKQEPPKPTGAAGAGKPATANGQQISMPGGRGKPPGRPAAGAGAGKAAPPAAKSPAAAKTAPPPAPKPAGPSPYDLACKVLDPWEKPMKGSEGLEWLASLDYDFIESADNAQYGVTKEQIDAAKLVVAGPQKAAPPPARAAAPAAAAEPAEDVAALQQRLLQFTKSLPTLAKSFKNNKKFLSELGGAQSIGALKDASRLQAMIQLCEEGDDSVAAALEDPAGWLETVG